MCPSDLNKAFVSALDKVLTQFVCPLHIAILADGQKLWRAEFYQSRYQRVFRASKRGEIRQRKSEHSAVQQSASAAGPGIITNE
jgi:hypothetical protein